MSGILLQNGKQAFTDANGRPLAGGRVYFYAPNTETPKDTWQDAPQTVLNTNPVILNARGEASIYGSGSYRQVLRDASGVLIWDAYLPDLVSSVTDLVNDLTGKSSTVVTNVAAMRLLNQVTYKNVMTLGYYTVGDGGSGYYYYDATDTTTADDGVGTFVTTTGGRYKLIAEEEITGKQAGAKGDGATIDRLRLQAGVNYCEAKSIKTFGIYDGTYILDQSLIIPPNMKIHGNATIKAAQTGYVGVIVAPFNLVGAAFTRPLFRNKGFFSLTISDTNITIEGLNFDFGSLVLSGGGCHAINFRRTRGVRIKYCTFNNGEDGTALLGCDDTDVIGCNAYGFSNCAYDHWDSPTNARLTNSNAVTASTAQMINFNAEPTADTTTTGLIGDGFTVTGGELTFLGATGSFSQIEPLIEGNGIRNVTINGTIFRNCSLAIRRNTSNVALNGPVFVGGYAGNVNPAIMCNALAGGTTPTTIALNGVIISDWRTSAANNGVITMFANGYTVSGCVVSGTNFFAALATGSFTGRIGANFFSVGTSGVKVIGNGGLPAWTPAPAFANSWINYGAGYAAASYLVDDVAGTVRLRGAIKTGTMNQIAFTLPSYLAPETLFKASVDSNNNYGAILVGADGTVTPVGGTNTQILLDNVCWRYK